MKRAQKEYYLLSVNSILLLTHIAFLTTHKSIHHYKSLKTKTGVSCS